METSFTCMIVDDESDAIDYLSNLINDKFEHLEIVATASNSKDAVKAYYSNFPDLIFMDIEIDELDGFGVLKEIYREKFQPYIIFVTAFNQYAVDAFRANALGYLLKPVHEVDLMNAVKKFMDSKERDLQYEKILSLFNYPARIRFNTRTGFILLNVNEIFYCEAERNYTKIHKVTGKTEIVSINLSEVEKKLAELGFWRVSRSCLANSGYITEVDRKQKTCKLSYNGEEIVIAASPKLIKRITF